MSDRQSLLHVRRAERNSLLHMYRYSVSYRRAWWDPRRLYACGNVERDEAERVTAYLRDRGEKGVRITWRVRV